MKKIFKIFILLLVLFAVGLGVYLVWKNFFKSTPVSAPASETGGIGVTVAPNLTAISSKAVFDYWFNQIDNSIYYITADGEIDKILSDGTEEKVVSQNFLNLHEIIPSFDGASAIISFGYPSQPTFTAFKTSDSTFTPFPEGTTSVAWKPNSSNEAAYLATNAATNVRNLNTWILGDKKTKEIIKISQKDLDLQWISPDTIYLKEKPSAEIVSKIWTVNLKTTKTTTEANIKTIAENPGLAVNWSKEGDFGLRFTSGRSEESRMLALVNNENKLIANFVFVTLPQKCVFDKKLLYCAVPNEVPLGTILPDDYLKRKVYFLDSLYKVDLSNDLLSAWNFEEIFDGLQYPIDAVHPIVNNQKLIFINRYDQKLYSLNMAPASTEQTPSTETEAAAETSTEE